MVQLLTGDIGNAWYDNRTKKKQINKRVSETQKKPTGLSGFVDSISNSFNTVARGGAEALNEFTGGNQRAAQQQQQTQQQDINTIKSLGQKMRSTTDPTEKARLQQAISKISQTGDKQTTQFKQRQNEIVKNVNPSKNVGALLDVGSLAVGGGSLGASGLKQAITRSGAIGALSSGMAGGGQTLRDNPNAKPDEIVGNTVGSAVTGGIIGGALPVAGRAAGGILNLPSKTKKAFSGNGVLGKVGAKAEKAGEDLMGSQANMTRAEARKVGALPGDVMANIQKRTGVSNLDTATRIGDNVTGQNGAYSELVRNAVGNSKGVDITDLRTLADDLMTDKAPLITGAERKNILEQMKNSAVSATGGSKGSLTTTAAPLDALDKAREFRGMAADIRKGATVSAKDKQLAQVYDDIGKEIEGRLYASEGVEEGLKLAAPDRANDLRNLATKTTDKAEKNAYLKLADELDNPDLDVKTARALQRDFVDAGKIQDYTARARSGAAESLGGKSTGLGKAVQNPLNLLAMPLDAATPKVGGILANLGRKTPKGTAVADEVSPETAQTQDMIKQIFSGDDGAIERGARMATPGAIQQVQRDEQTGAELQGLQGELEQNQGVEDQLLTLNDQLNEEQALAEQEANDPFSETNMKQIIAQDLAQTGGKNISSLLKVYETLGAGKSSDDKKLSASQKTAVIKSNSADAILDSIQSQVGDIGLQDNGVLARILGKGNEVAGNVGLNQNAKVYSDTSRGMASQLAKALGESGNLSDQDIQRAISLIPKLTDSKYEANQKLGQIRGIINTIKTSTLNI